MSNVDWWHGAVLYQIYPRSFMDSDGDGVGDLPGIAARLDHVASLGADAVWLGPFYASPQTDFGFDVSDHRDADPRMGALADVDALIERAHALGLKVVIDQIWSHTSDQHPWFSDSRSGRDAGRADWYVWADPASGGGPPNGWLSVFGGPAWTWEPRRGQFYLRRFLDCEPALNLRHPSVVDALIETMHFWAYRGVDGMRFAAADFLLHDPALRDDMLQPGMAALLARIRATADAYPGLCTIGEVSSRQCAPDRVARSAGGEDGLHMAYALRPLRGLDPQALNRLLDEAAASGGQGWPCWSFGSHDDARAASRMAGGLPEAGRLLVALMLSLRGGAVLYQGDELSLPQAELAPGDLRDPAGLAAVPGIPGRDGSRTPMPWCADAPGAGFTAGRPWLPIPDAHRELAVDRQEADPASPLHACRAFLRWRAREPALRRGTLRRLPLPPPLIGFLRSDGPSHILAAFNLSSEPASLDLADFDSVAPCPESGFPSLVADGRAELPPFGAFFARVEPASEWQEEAALSFA